MPTAIEALRSVFARDPLAAGYDTRRGSYRPFGFRGYGDVEAVMRSAPPPTVPPPAPATAAAVLRSVHALRPPADSSQSGIDYTGYSSSEGGGGMRDNGTRAPGGYAIPAGDILAEFLSQPDRSWGQRAAGLAVGAIPGVLPGFGHFLGGALNFDTEPRPQRDFGVIGARAQREAEQRLTPEMETRLNEEISRALTQFPELFGIPQAPLPTQIASVPTESDFDIDLTASEIDPGRNESATAPLGATAPTREPTAAPAPAVEGQESGSAPSDAPSESGPTDPGAPESSGPSPGGNPGQGSGAEGGSPSGEQSRDPGNHGRGDPGDPTSESGGNFAARGGRITKRTRANPPGPDNTYVAAQTGEHVLSRRDVAGVKRGGESAASVLHKVVAGKPAASAPPRRQALPQHGGKAVDVLRQVVAERR